MYIGISYSLRASPSLYLLIKFHFGIISNVLFLRNSERRPEYDRRFYATNMNAYV